MAEHESNPIADYLMKSRTVVLDGKITNENVGDVIFRLLTLQSQSLEQITLVINSRGGERDAGLELHDLIRYVLTAPVRAIVTGNCASAATFVLLACKERLAMPHAKFLIHSGRLGTSLRIDDVTTAQMHTLLAELQKSAKEIEDLYATALGTSEAEVKALIARGDRQFDCDIYAAEALELGIITGIVDDNIGIFAPPQRSSNS